MHRFLAWSIAPCALALVFACGGSTDNTPDAGDDAGMDQPETMPPVEAGPDVDNGSPSTTYPAFKVDPPQVVSGPGTVLSAPKIVPVFFQNDDTTFTGDIVTWLNKLPGSTYWGPQVMEYGVGAITIATPVVIAEDAPPTTTDTAIQSWLSGKISDATLPTPDANTVYALYYPAATTAITLQTDTSCVSGGFGGYHNNITVNAKTIAYAVMPRCAKFGSLTGVDAVTGTSSHEFIEAATDPYPASQTTAAFSGVDDNHILWEFALGGGEVGDLCAQFPNAFYTPTDLGNAAQRTWSNKAAKAGHDPCVVSDGTPYFNSMPVLPDDISILGMVTTKGVNIAVGSSATLEVDLFSDAATSGPWMVSAVDGATLQKMPTTMTFAWDRTTGTNGEKLHLTVNVTSKPQYGIGAILITSTLGTHQNLWLAAVNTN